MGSSPIRATKIKNMEEEKKMAAITGFTIRNIIKAANEIGITRDAIVSLLKENGQYVLVYFK